jgi:translation elongation factor EF-1alpha
MLAKALGVFKLIVLVNKMDEVDWSEKRFNYIKDQTSPFLKTNCGYDLDQVDWIPIAGLHGDNMKEKSANSKASWYTGKPMFDTLDDLLVPERKKDAPIRIPILDKVKESGVFVFGRVESGAIVPGIS